MKFFKGNSLNNFDNSPGDDWKLIYSLQNKKFNTIKILIEVLIMSCYAFGLGYSLFYLQNIMKTSIVFLIVFLISYLIILLPHEVLHVIWYPNKNDVNIIYSLLKLKFISYTDGSISKPRALVILIVPFIILTIIPTVISYLLGFNLFLYALASSNAIKSGIDLLNFILIIKNVPANSILKVDGYNFYFKTNKVIDINTNV